MDASGVNLHLHLIWRRLLLVVPINDHMEFCTLCTSSKERWLGICKNSDYMTQATLAQVAILVQTITSEFLKWTGRCCLYPLNGSSVLLLLAGNCLPYTINQSFLQPKTPRKQLGLLGFFLRCLFGDSAYTHPWGVPRPNTLVDSQLHQMHLMHPT